MSNIKQSWRPTASIENIKTRAVLMSKIREFFRALKVLEVDTPSLSHSTIPDPYILSLQTKLAGNKTLYLQTSPEFHMKRLLASGSGCIYQIAHAFRDDEVGKMHNPEFSMLEWYRLGFDQHQLMQEVAELILAIVPYQLSIQFYSYRKLFLHYLDFDPFEIKLTDLQNKLQQYAVMLNSASDLDHDTCLQLLLTHAIEPKFSNDSITFIYNFPASQAALARLHTDEHGIQVAARFEAYVGQVELANGFHELTDTVEQRQRFEENIQQRHDLKITAPPLDEYLLGALESGLPDCAGVALGVDRLLMLAMQAKHISEVQAFSYSNC